MCCVIHLLIIYSIFFSTYVTKKPTRFTYSWIFSTSFWKKYITLILTLLEWVWQQTRPIFTLNGWDEGHMSTIKKMGIKNTKWFSILAAYTYLFFFFPLLLFISISDYYTMLTCIVLFIWSHDEKSVTILAPSWSHSLRFLKINICYFNSSMGEKLNYFFKKYPYQPIFGVRANPT